MRTLIYSLAVGDAAWDMATLMVKSLRQFGNFGGDIHIYTERDAKMDGAKTIRLPDLLLMPHATMGKVYIGKTLNTWLYDKVVWIDADVVAIQDVAPVFELLGTHIAGERILTQEFEIASWSIPEAPCAIGDLGVNTGLVMADAQDWRTICQTWWNGLMDAQGWRRPAPFYDQCVFNHLWRHGAIRAEAMPLGTMHFMVHGAVFGEHTRFVHTRTPIKYETMRLLVDLLNQQKEQREDNGNRERGLHRATSNGAGQTDEARHGGVRHSGHPGLGLLCGSHTD